MSRGPAGESRRADPMAVPESLRQRIDDRGLWRDVRTSPPAGAPRPALFLDRDGTVIDEVPYLSRPERVRPIAEAVAAIARANALAVPVVVVTNQSGIERGVFGWATYAAVEDAVAAALAAGGAHIDAVYACPRMPTEPLPFGRKPDPGMLVSAAGDLNLDLAASWIAGDCATDIEAGLRAGLRRGWLVPTGYGGRDAAAARSLARDGFEVIVGQRLAALTPRLDELSIGRAGRTL